MDFYHVRTVTAKLLWIALCVIVLCRGEALPVSSVCLSSNGTACNRHRLSCGSDTDRLVLLDAVQGFSPSPTSPTPRACPGDACSTACCQLTSFPCSAPVSNRQYSTFFTECWGKRTCAPAAALDAGGNTTSLETERDAACNGSASLSALSYQCLPESSYREFWNDTSVEGSTVAARFTRYVPGWETAQRCSPPTDTLRCDVTASGGEVLSPGNVTVTLVMHHSISRPRSCSALQLRVAGSTTVEHPCLRPIEFVSQRVELRENSSLELVLSIRDEVLPFQAWALATAENGNLTMTCGLGTCSGVNISIPTLVDSSSTTPPPSTQRPCSCPPSAPRQSRGNDAVFFPLIMALGSLCVLLMITQSITLILLVRRRRAALDQIYALDDEYSQPGEHEDVRSYPVTQGSTASHEQILLEDMTAVEDSGNVNGAATSIDE